MPAYLEYKGNSFDILFVYRYMLRLFIDKYSLIYRLFIATLLLRVKNELLCYVIGISIGASIIFR